MRYARALIAVMVLAALGWMFGWFFYVLIIIPVGLRYLIDAKERDMYLSGALLPGLVVDNDKRLVAMLTDLSTGFGSYPIIRIEQLKVPTSHNKKLTKLAIAGAYQKTEDYAHWNYFSGSVLLAGMKRPEHHSRLLGRIPKNEWDKLYNLVRHWDKPISPGYYPIEIETSSWKGESIDEIKWVQ